MTLTEINKELAQIEERKRFLESLAASLREAMPGHSYACQGYDKGRLCMYERRALDRGCDGCQRVSGI